VDPAATLFVDDSVAVLRAARAAGVHAIYQVLWPDSTQPLRVALPGFTAIRGLGDLLP
jgi:FMN phosphatase YigB (HAD superfamily)